MAKKSQQEAIVLAVCQVTRSKEDLEALILTQIEQGEAILAKYPPYMNNGYYAPAFDQNNADQFYAEYKAWKEFCEEIYTTSFDIKDTKYLEQFTNAEIFMGLFSESWEVYNHSLSNLRKQINELNSFIKRIPLIYPN